ncbi:MAG TPA: choice-of-anchor B family protein, partial [Bacteroidia bacterium]|nr:choice-of-anchor B family protein [Bacteroidia bacterium]
MKRLLFLLAFAPVIAHSQTYDAQNVSMLGQWNNPSQPAEPTYGIKYQGVWGWKDTTNNHEYGIIGSSTGVNFIDVTNPASPVMCDYVPSRHGNLIWHEIKTYRNYCYVVSDDVSPNSFQIIDMSYLPDSVHVLYDDTTVFERCHTIFVDGDKLWCGSVTRRNNNYYSMAAYDLSADPVHPQLIRVLHQDYGSPATVHDMFVRNDTVYASGGYDGLFIYVLDDTLHHFHEIAALQNYPEQGYNHSSFLSQDGRTLIFTDEVPAGLGMKSLDVSDMSNITMNQVFRSNQGDTPHNPYIIGNNVLVSANYCDGIQVFNIGNPSNVVRTGYFDTDTLINYPNYTQAYHGAWGAYTDLPSGHILGADMQNGLYILDISQAILASVPENVSTVMLNAYPNPFNTNFFINLGLDKAQDVTYTIFDNEGRMIREEKQSMPAGNSILEVDGEGLVPGMYSVRVTGETVNGTSR